MQIGWVELQKRPLWVLEHLGSNCWNLGKSLNVIYRGGGTPPFLLGARARLLGPLALSGRSGHPRGSWSATSSWWFQVASRVSWEIFGSYPAPGGPVEAFVADQRHWCSAPFGVAYQDSMKQLSPDQICPSFWPSNFETLSLYLWWPDETCPCRTMWPLPTCCLTVKPSVPASFSRITRFLSVLNEHGRLAGASIMMRLFGASEF